MCAFINGLTFWPDR